MNRGALIITLRKRYKALRLTETLLFALGASGVIWGVLSWLSINIFITCILAVVVAIAVAIFRIVHLRINSVTDERISYFLNGKFDILQDSSELLIRPHEQLSVLEKIQVTRLERAIESLSKIKLPHRLLQAVIIFIVGMGAVFLSGFSSSISPSSSNNGTPSEEQAVVTPQSPPQLTAQSLDIQPPAYTGIKESSIKHMSASVVEGSLLTWNLSFSEQPSSVALVFSNGDSTTLKPDAGRFTVNSKLRESVIYQIKWKSSFGVQASDYFEITVKPDGAPTATITDLQQFTRLAWRERSFIDVPVLLRDDYGLSRGHIIATVAKGSGESIKFREETLAFETPASISGREVQARRRINFNQLGMEPGDEIYFYAEVWDNKTPEHQRTRTETFFVSLQDTASHMIVADASLGVDLMPEYFRSQRQIIIDTEKLLKDQPKISKQAFNSTSNELGYDQKVLRLKYGQFLGEEFETAIGEPAHEAEEEDDEEDPTKKYGHQHDKENEHNLVAEKKPEAGHEHAEEEDEKDPMAAFKHNHDNMEEATFFTQSVRAKLKAALTLMWEAELQLRLFEPKASLPVQYKILKLLKEISQDSRIYVHRMGFDPPPLKEEKRLTGDLEEIRGQQALGAIPSDKPYPAIRRALVSLNAAIQTKTTMPDEQLKSDLQNAATEIAAASISAPGNYLVHLSMIRSILDGTIHESELLPALKEIQSACWNIVPYEDPGPGQSNSTRHPLDAELLKELKKPTNE